jgi:hypothetical protein
MMRRVALFTPAVASTIALTLAANATIFSAVNAVLIRPLPFGRPNWPGQVAEKKER